MIIYLNTSNVNVNHILLEHTFASVLNLNTSNVNVNLKYHLPFLLMQLNLNTSNVNVNLFIFDGESIFIFLI